ncbi:hypothetical protein [Pseudomonas phage D6]|nr:hypothetical protein [Pseudomonas phage D6]
MFDLSTVDVFRPGDVVVTFRKDDNDTVKKYIEIMKAQGMEIWAYSDRGDHMQYLLVPDIEERKAASLASDQNSASGLFSEEAKNILLSKPGMNLGLVMRVS